MKLRGIPVQPWLHDHGKGLAMRLGLDIGTNSIGWWLYDTVGTGPETRACGVIDGGVRIFSDGRDPKSGASLAVNRRAARAMRRRRDRYLRRRTTLMKVLADAGLMPANPQDAKALTLIDPYELRARGLDEALPVPHLGRALFHLNQRRGFKSNRKTDRNDNESGKIKDATQRLDWAMRDANARTYGEFLHGRRLQVEDARQVPAVRTRLTVAVRNAPDAQEEAGYDFYPDRRHIEGEFHAIWEAQARHHPDVLTTELRDLVFEKIFYQRPLREPEIGLCLFTAEDRLTRSHPLTQRRVLLETINQLRITADGREARRLTKDERDALVHALDNKAPTKSLASMKMTFAALGKVLKLPRDQRFTLQTSLRDAIACDPVRACLSHPDRFGRRWSTLDWREQWDVINRIREVQNDSDYAALVTWLMETHGIDAAHAEAKRCEPAPHVRHPGRQPDLRIARNRDHGDSPRISRASISGSKLPLIRNR